LVLTEDGTRHHATQAKGKRADGVQLGAETGAALKAKAGPGFLPHWT
jgi:hypothetical protein